MNGVIPLKSKRIAVDVIDALNTKLRDINAVMDLMATCVASECDVNGAAFAIQRMVEDAQKLADELYRAPKNHLGGAS